MLFLNSFCQKYQLSRPDISYISDSQLVPQHAQQQALPKEPSKSQIYGIKALCSMRLGTPTGYVSVFTNERVFKISIRKYGDKCRFTLNIEKYFATVRKPYSAIGDRFRSYSTIPHLFDVDGMVAILVWIYGQKCPTLSRMRT